MADTYASTAVETADVQDGNVPTPDDTDEKILERSRRGLKERIDAEGEERKKMEDDLRFCTLDQWPAEVRRAREGDPNGARPCLTSDEINQYIVQVENDMRHNRPSIKPRPVDDKSDPATAEIFAGLIRHIEDQSNATVAYVTGGGSAVRIGLGYFRVTTEYVSPDSFDQEPRIVRIPNTFSVYLGAHIQPDGSDADEGWIIEQMPLEQFKREYPKAKVDSKDFEGLGVTPTWRGEDTVTVVEYFYTKYTKVDLLFLKDGSTVYADEYDGKADNVVERRSAQKKAIKWCKHTGVEILQKRDWLGKYIPIIEVVGKESYVDGKRVLWGLVRPAKDMLRMKNYWLSAATEKIALAPKVPFVGAEGQFEGHEQEWKRANIDNRAYLEYKAIDVNGNAIPRPERVQPAPMEAAIVNMLGIIEHDVQKSLGMFKASVGESESQQSGKAILALQRESDTGTFHFQDNLSLSIQYCGRILIDLIPKVIDTRRVLRILGEDGQSKAVTVDPEQPQAVRKIADEAGKVRSIYNLGVGTYDVTVSTGPSYSTSRQEAATVLTELANSAKDPASAAVMRYMAIKNSDFHGSDEMVKALRALLPPPVLAAMDSNEEPIPPAAQAKINELTQQAQMMNEAGNKLAQENQVLKSGAQEAQAKIAVDAKAKEADFALRQQEAQRQAEYDVWKAKLDAETKVVVAQIAAKTALTQAELQMDTDANVELLKPVNEEGEGEVRPLDKLAALHQQGMDQHSQSMDALATGLTQALANIGEILQRGLALQEQTLAAIREKKRTSISGIQRDANGNIIGATVATTPTVQ